MTILLFTDVHLDDQRANEYRWGVFPQVAAACTAHGVSRAYCLGDMTDKRDRFPAGFVNRLVGSLIGLPVPVTVLRGNHDTTVSGPAFWEFLSSIPGVEYVTRPTVHDDLLLLPFSPDPMVEWRGLRMRDYRAIFLHATVTGAIAENGYVLSGQDLPLLPRSAAIYSGDVHNAQQVRNVTYVGASHPVKFGDDYPCRFLLLDDDYAVAGEVPVATINKRVVNIASVDDLGGFSVRPGDQVRVRVAALPGQDWGAFEAGVEAWARIAGVEVTSIEGSFDVVSKGPNGTPVDDASPEDRLAEFARAEGVTDRGLLDLGIELLREVRGS